MQAALIIPQLEEVLESDRAAFLDYPRRVKRHQRRSTAISVHTAQELRLLEREIEILKIAGIWHDYGKRGWHYEMMFKRREDMTKYECFLVDMHAGASYALMHNVIKLSKRQDIVQLLNGALQPILETVRFHHKDYNGNGYPDGVSAEEAPFGAHVLRVADSYDAMRSPRLYRSTGKQMMTHEEAVAEIERNTGKEFHPDVVRAFLKIPQEILDELYAGVSHLTPKMQREIYGEVHAPAPE
jgi:HD-GYP domain-containing protein (c-di-GMP phosphodiesterase class II)